MAVDVAESREKDRRRRLWRLAAGIAPIAAWMWWRVLSGNPVSPGFPDLGPDAMLWLPLVLLVVIIAAVLILPMLGNGRSPHITYMPEQIEIGFEDVAGLGPVLHEVRHTLDVFLNHKRFRDEMGGTPRRGVLFEGPPGTGKTYVAKAIAKEAGVPFLFVSSTAFQSMWYGATARKIRSYFRQLRKVARREGGAIGFIEEIDAIASRRGGLSFRAPLVSPSDAFDASVERSSISEGTGGVVNELLVQMQSFDEPTRGVKLHNALARFVNRFLPAHRQVASQTASFANILLIGATNRADSLDPALLRPGRFDRILHIGLPGLRSRRELIDYFLTKKAHHRELDQSGFRNDLAAQTMGYSPAALERLFDEALLVALRQDRKELTMADVRRAQLEVEIGLPNPVDYPSEEREIIATHEAGHATVAYLMGKGRRLEVLSIIKRKDALGLLAHRDTEERFNRGAAEMRSFIQIAFGGMVAEELFFGESGSGPSGDLVGATQTAAVMVGAYGLGGSLVSFEALDDGVMRGNLVSKVLRDERARELVDKLLHEAKREVGHLLDEHRYLVEALRDALLEREELFDKEILEVLRRAEARALDGGRVVVDLRHENGRITPGRRDVDPVADPDRWND